MRGSAAGAGRCLSLQACCVPNAALENWQFSANLIAKDSQLFRQYVLDSQNAIQFAHSGRPKHADCKFACPVHRSRTGRRDGAPSSKFQGKFIGRSGREASFFLRRSIISGTQRRST
jgi:hypothetical protein